jgi:exosome complex component RRP41
MVKTDEKLIVDGKRLDGRKPEDLRPVEMEMGFVERADGSARVRFGGTEAVAAVYGPRKLYPRFMQENDRGILRCKYNMAPFSTEDRVRPGRSRRSIELSKVIRLSLEASTFLDDFPKTVVDVFIEMLQSDGSTRVTGINAASLALAAAGIPMRDIVVACSVGKIGDDLVSDLNGIEDNNSEADVAIAMLPTKSLVTLLQMDGRVTKNEMFELLDNGEKKCQEIYEMQKKTLKEHYKRDLNQPDKAEVE